MLNRSHRLLTLEDFRRVFRRGHKVPVSGGLIVVMPNNLSLSRWGFVVSKAVGSAVVRNGVKRRLRAAAQHLLSEVGGVDVVIRADARAPGLSVADWVSAIRSIVTRHGS